MHFRAFSKVTVQNRDIFGGLLKFQIFLGGAGLEISENRHLPCITKLLAYMGENLIFTRNIKNFHLPCSLRHS